jgi:hypothetical protein
MITKDMIDEDLQSNRELTETERIAIEILRRDGGADRESATIRVVTETGIVIGDKEVVHEIEEEVSEIEDAVTRRRTTRITNGVDAI